MQLQKEISALREAGGAVQDTHGGRPRGAHLSELECLDAMVDSKRVWELTRRVEDLERQVIALSRAPMALSQQVKDLQEELRMARLGAKGKLTEEQIRTREKARFSEGKKKVDKLMEGWIGMHLHERGEFRKQENS